MGVVIVFNKKNSCRASDENNISLIVHFLCISAYRPISDGNKTQIGHKWKISAPRITINNPVATLMRTSINLVTKQIYNPMIVT